MCAHIDYFLSEKNVAFTEPIFFKKLPGRYRNFKEYLKKLWILTVKKISVIDKIIKIDQFCLVTF